MAVLGSPSLIIIIKRISRAPIYHTRWQHKALYNNNNHTHTHTLDVIHLDVITVMTQRVKTKVMKMTITIMPTHLQIAGGTEHIIQE